MQRHVDPEVCVKTKKVRRRLGQAAFALLAVGHMSLTWVATSALAATAFRLRQPPRISSISPSSGPTAGGTAARITGSGFRAGVSVTIGGALAKVASLSSSSLAITTPAHAAGAADVVVANPDGQRASLAGGYTYVDPSQPPQISSVSPTSGSTAGGTPVVIAGSGFGAGAAVALGGTSATVVTVTPTSIAITTPAHAAGSVSVVVTNSNGLTATLANGFTYVDPTKPPAGTLLWQVALNGYSYVRPAVGPDGTVYAIDVLGTLHAVAPNGAVRWRVAGAGNKGLAVAADGTIFVASEANVRAFAPNGAALWTYAQNPSAYLLVGLSVGPDGNLYAVASNGLGVFSLTPSGALRWTNKELFNQPIVSYGEIVFGPGAGGPQMYFYANHHVRGLGLDGRSIFELYLGGQPAVSPFDGTVHISAAAYWPDGVLAWNTGHTSGDAPTVGPDGTHYGTSLSRFFFAIDPQGQERWQVATPKWVSMPAADPTGTQVLLAALDPTTYQGFLEARRTADGALLWSLALPSIGGSQQHVDFPGVRFSADGSKAYLVAAGGGYFLTAVQAR